MDSTFIAVESIAITDYHPFLINFYTNTLTQNDDSLTSSIESKFHKLLPQTIINFVNQPLIYNNINKTGTFVIEVFYINFLNSKVEFDKNANTFHLINENIDFLCVPSRDNSTEKYSNIFKNLNQQLLLHNHSFIDVIRQWNYLPRICDINNNRKSEYSIFNSIRKDFYLRDKIKIFPAATGIGISGKIAQIIVFSLKGNFIKYQIENNLQTSAYHYSENTIVSESKTKFATPMFSRGVILEVENKKTFFLSGTASIRGEDTIGDDIIAQFNTTIENIKYLISQENIEKQINKKYKLVKPNYLKIYIKDRNQLGLIQNKIQLAFPNCDYFIVEADVCRSNLLLEIEGIFDIIE